MQAYDGARFDPPAPFALVIVKSVGIVIHDVSMLIDTGADVSLLPRLQVESLRVPDAKQYELEGFDGAKSTAPAIPLNCSSWAKPFAGNSC